MAWWVPRCFHIWLHVSILYLNLNLYLINFKRIIFLRYNLLFFLLTYLIPMIGMGICYYQMGYHLWKGDKTILQLVMIPQAAMAKSRTDKKRVSVTSGIFKLFNAIIFQIVKMFAVVVFIFMVCWAPYHIYFIFVFHNPSVTQSAYIGHIYLFFYWLAMANSCVNPIIYYWMNVRFRAYFNKVLCCVPCFLKQSTIKTWRRASSSLGKPSPKIRRPYSHSCPVQLNMQCFLPDSNQLTPRPIGLRHSHTASPSIRTMDSSTNTVRKDSTSHRKSLLSLDTHVSYISEVLLWKKTCVF